MKNYSKNIESENRRNKMGKSPDFGTRKNILDISPDKIDLQKNLTYKRRTRNNYYNYNSLLILFLTNSFFHSFYKIWSYSSCYWSRLYFWKLTLFLLKSYWIGFNIHSFSQFLNLLILFFLLLIF